MPEHPKAFVSYSWDNESHKKWVADLAARLRADGVDAHVDQWHAVPGDQLPHFMEREIRDNHFVVVICTPNYKRKSDNRTGGVGYEGDIMTAEVLTSGNHRKFIPVLAQGTWAESAPCWLTGKYFVDLSDPEKQAQNYQDLLGTIVGSRPQAPPLGVAAPGPHTSSPRPAGQQVQPEPIRILGVVIDEVTEPTMDGTPGSALYRVPFRLSRRPSIDWTQHFLQAWQFPPRFTTMHRPGIADVVGDRLVLNGTTIEEVQRYHKTTLQLCVSVANEKEAEQRARVAQQQALEQQRREGHRRTIEDISSQIRFDE
jgi:hypothetical protein